MESSRRGRGERGEVGEKGEGRAAGEDIEKPFCGNLVAITLWQYREKMQGNIKDSVCVCVCVCVCEGVCVYVKHVMTISVGK